MINEIYLEKRLGLSSHYNMDLFPTPFWGTNLSRRVSTLGLLQSTIDFYIGQSKDFPRQLTIICVVFTK